MKSTHKSKSDNAWDNRELGASEKHVRKASADREKALDDRLGLQSISIRLQKNLVDSLKRLADADGIGYQPYVRQILTRYVREIEGEKRVKIKQAKGVIRSR